MQTCFCGRNTETSGLSPKAVPLAASHRAAACPSALPKAPSPAQEGQARWQRCAGFKKRSLGQKFLYVPFHFSKLGEALFIDRSEFSPNIAKALFKTLPAFQWQFRNLAECAPCANSLPAASLTGSHGCSAELPS